MTVEDNIAKSLSAAIRAVIAIPRAQQRKLIWEAARRDIDKLLEEKP